MKALILAAGYATRLYPITSRKPKPLLTIKGKPIIDYIIAKLEQIKDINEIIVITNSRYIKEFQRWQQNFPCALPVRLIDDGSTNEQDKLGSIGDIAFAIKEANIREDLLVVGGDNLFSFSLNKFVEFVKGVGHSVSIGTYNLNGKLQPNKFGVLKLDEQCRIIDFQEKPASINGSFLVSMCLYFFPADKLPMIHEYINQQNNPDQCGHYISWLSKRDTVYGYTFNEGSWFDIGDIDAYTEAVFTF